MKLLTQGKRVKKSHRVKEDSAPLGGPNLHLPAHLTYDPWPTLNDHPNSLHLTEILRFHSSVHFRRKVHSSPITNATCHITNQVHVYIYN